MIGEEKGSVAISGRSSHKMTGLIGNLKILIPLGVVSISPSKTGTV